MKPGFALSLSFDGICLLQRAAGGWRSIGEVSLETGDLGAELAALRDKALAYGDEDLTCKVIVPNEQIRYLGVDTDGADDTARDMLVREALQGATPYAVDDLVYDLSLDGGTTYVSAVARETLAEAEAFAVEHGFNPVSFVAAPGENQFLGEPFFGPSAHAKTLPGPPEVEPDGIAVVVIGPASPPPKPTPEPSSEPAPEPAETQPPAFGFSSRRKLKETAKQAPVKAPVKVAEPAQPQSPPSTPVLGGAKRDAPPPAVDKPAPVAFRSVQSAAAKTDATPAAEPISVTAPTLDIPEPPPDPVPEPDPDAPGEDSFLTRRNGARRITPVPVAPPIPIQASDPVLSAGAVPETPGFVSAAPSTTRKDEATRMTVFGARDQQQIGGKPRHFGLILAAVLLLFLAAVAAWASIFLENGVAGLFRSSPAQTTAAVIPAATPRAVENDTAALAPAPAAPDVTPPAAPALTTPQVNPQDPTTLAQLPPPSIDIPSLPPPQFVTQPTPPASPQLSDTDSAVLDALRQPDQPADPTEPVAEAEPDLAPDGENAPENIAENTDDTAPPVTRAATGVLQTAPQVPDTPSIIGLDDLYIASIDRTDLSQDAVALPTRASLATDLPLGSVNSPVAAGTEFTLDQRGLVTATVDGTLNPGGIMVYLGRPPVVPRTIPARLTRDITPDSPTETAAETPPDRLAAKRPRARPNNLGERFERSNLGGLTRDELKRRRPKARPDSLQQQAAPADAPPTAQAVASSRIPRARPKNFQAIVSAALRPAQPGNLGSAVPSQPRQTTTPTAPQAPQSSAPNIPSSASVARQATLKNEINLRRVNLIGVYGTPSNRRALVRLPSGRYKKVKVGDSVDGGRVVAIGESELRYQKKGRNMTLKIPSS